MVSHSPHRNEEFKTTTPRLKISFDSNSAASGARPNVLNKGKEYIFNTYKNRERASVDVYPGTTCTSVGLQFKLKFKLMKPLRPSLAVLSHGTICFSIFFKNQITDFF